MTRSTIFSRRADSAAPSGTGSSTRWRSRHAARRVVRGRGRLEPGGGSVGVARPRWRQPRCWSFGHEGQFDRDGFQDRGSKTTSLPSVDAQCLRATLGACPRGSILAFSVRGAAVGTFVTSYFEPTTPITPDPRVWLLSNEPTAAQAPGAIGVLARGARVPDRQDAGRYHLEVLVTKRPLSREEATRTRLGDDLVSRARFDLTVPP